MLRQNKLSSNDSNTHLIVLPLFTSICLAYSFLYMLTSLILVLK